MSDDKNQSIQLEILDDIMDNITNLYKYCISLEERVGDIEVDARHDRETIDKLCHDIGKLKTVQEEHVRTIKSLCVKVNDMESDITYLFHLTHGGDNFCGNCEHCISCPDGLYRCDITNMELDPDNSSCIRFKCPQIPKSDAEICKACSDKNTPRCYKCSHFPF